MMLETMTVPTAADNTEDTFRVTTHQSLVGVIGSITQDFDEDALFRGVEGLLDSLSVVNPVLLHGGKDTGTAASVVNTLKSRGIYQSLVRDIAFPPISMIDDTFAFSSYQFFVRNKQIVNSSDFVIIILDSNRAREAETNPVLEYCQDIGKPHFILTV